MEEEKIEFEGTMSIGKSMMYLDELLKAFRVGKICIQDQVDAVVLSPMGDVELKIKAERNAEEESLSLKLRWVKDVELENQSELKISSQEPVRSVSRRLSKSDSSNDAYAEDEEIEMSIKNKANGKKKYK